ncbi:MAG: hypothetical protein FWD26_00740 [Treponema sp.]|nr:hypothetical protein [Treponema sp.]
MKKKFFNLTFAVLILLVSLAGCPDLDQPLIPVPEEGKGFVNLQFAADIGRTILPSSYSFAGFELIFTPNPNGTAQTINNNTPGVNLGQLQVSEGTYLLEVRVFNNAQRQTRIASASGLALTVSRTTPATVLVPLVFTQMTGNGTLGWGITGVSPNVTNIILTRLDATGTVTKNTLSGNDTAVPAGYYLATVRLERELIAANSGASAIIWDDILHIYPGQTTRLDLTFTDSDYSNNMENMWLISGTETFLMNINNLGYFSIQRNMTANSTFAFSVSNPAVVTTANQRACLVPAANNTNAAIGRNTTTFQLYTPAGSATANNRWRIASAGLYNFTVNPVTREFSFSNANNINIIETSGWLETFFVKWEKMDNVPKFNVYYRSSGTIPWIQIDDPLIREYQDHMRADILGISAGTYEVQVRQVNDLGVEFGNNATATGISVIAHTREGFAFLNSRIPGAYNLNGTPKAGARILYITNTNKDVVKLGVRRNNATTEIEYTGLQAILTAYEGGFEERPLIVRFVGRINEKRGSAFTDSAGSVMIKGTANRPNTNNGMNITFEGVGHDATVYGWGFRTSRASGVEIRNLGFILGNTDDKDAIELQNSNHIWVHNNDLFYCMPGSASDQKKGDGTLDIKACDLITVSFNHFWDSGKSSLLGNSASETPGRVTYHHNWFNHSDSRHPLVRVHKVHLYNNFYDNVGKYGIIARVGASVFAERNYFQNTKKPILISQQGTDIVNGTGNAISSDNGGIIKAFDNFMDSFSSADYRPWSSANTIEFDAYPVTAASNNVPSSVTAKKGGAVYDNSFLTYSYNSDSPTVGRDKVMQYAGRYWGGDLRFTFPPGSQTLVDNPMPELLLLLQNYSSRLVAIQGSDLADDGPSNPPVCSVCGVTPCACGGDPLLTGTVTITGTAQVGQTLTANTGSLGGSGTISYQWRRASTNVGTNSNTYTAQSGDLGATITVTVTRAGHSGSVTSAPTAAVIAAGGGTNPPAVSGLILISSDFSAVTVSDSLYKGLIFGTGWANPISQTATVAGTTFTHRTTNGGGANGNQRYFGIPLSGPATVTLYICANGSNAGTLGINHTTGISATKTAVTTGHTVIAGGTNASLPGEIVYNSTVTGYHILWVFPSLSSRLFGVSVSGGGGGDPVLTGTVTISGTAQVGQTLTANTSGLNGTGAITYQWRRGASTNIGTNSNTYILQSADQGSTISVIVTRGGTTGSLTGGPTAVVTGTGGGDPPGFVWRQATIGNRTTSNHIRQAGDTSIVMSARATTQQGWTTADGNQNGNFIYINVTGNFEFTVRISDLTSSSTNNANDRIGIIAMDANPANLNIAAPSILNYAAPFKNAQNPDPRSLARNNGAAPSHNQLSPAGSRPDLTVQTYCYLRITRNGNTFTTAASSDGTAWATRAETLSTAPDVMYIGLLVSGMMTTADSAATFSEVTLKHGTGLTETYIGNFSSLFN